MRLIVHYFLFGFCFMCYFCSRDIPRLTLRQDTSGPGHQLSYNRNLSHTVFFLQDGTENLFIGGTNYVLQVNISNGHIIENITLSADQGHTCDKSSCENAVTVIEKFDNSIFVCGTNGEDPRCWKLIPTESNRFNVSDELIDGTGISPHTCSQNSISLVVDGDLCAAAPLYKDGTSLQFRRKVGKKISMWMFDPWITEPTFISAFLASRPQDKLNEKMYVLFREKNSDSSPEADPWISRIARVCKVDKGGSKSFFQNIWTSFLKARLSCGIPTESLYFNRLHDIFVLHSEDWRNSRVYALFSSSWNSSAVCVYSLEELDSVFESSSFKGYNEAIPSLRPGTCVEDSRALPRSTINVVKLYPEMTDWVQPIQKDSPLYISSNNYTKIVVDRVQAADGKVYSVLLLATDTGKIHKILEDSSGGEPFIISQTQLCNGSAPVLSMKLNSEKKKLFVGYPGRMAVLDLQSCHYYSASCQDCVLARDPYCAWTENGCTSQLKGGIQNIATGETNGQCTDKVTRRKRDASSSSPFVPEGNPYYLSCPIESHHATYTWVHDKYRSPCQLTQSDCLFLIPSVSAGDYGDYTCESKERDYTKVVKKYTLNRYPELRRAFNSAFRMTAQKEWLLIVFAAVFFRARLPD